MSENITNVATGQASNLAVGGPSSVHVTSAESQPTNVGGGVLYSGLEQPLIKWSTGEDVLQDPNQEQGLYGIESFEKDFAKKQETVDTSTQPKSGLSNIPALPPVYDPSVPPPSVVSVGQQEFTDNTKSVATGDSSAVKASATVKLRPIKGGSQQSLSSLSSGGSQKSLDVEEPTEIDRKKAREQSDKQFVLWLKHKSEKHRKGKKSTSTGQDEKSDSNTSLETSSGTEQLTTESLAKALSTISVDKPKLYTTSSRSSLNIGSNQSLESSLATSGPPSTTSSHSSLNIGSAESLQSNLSKSGQPKHSSQSVDKRKEIGAKKSTKGAAPKKGIKAHASATSLGSKSTQSVKSTRTETHGSASSMVSTAARYLNSMPQCFLI